MSAHPPLAASFLDAIDTILGAARAEIFDLISIPNIEEVGHETTLIGLAEEILKHRRRRARLFDDDGELFGEPAWDIMLDLYVSSRKRAISVLSACLASGVPPTTALRALERLGERGLVERRPDPNDGRRYFVEMTPRAERLLERWLLARAGVQLPVQRRSTNGYPMP